MLKSTLAYDKLENKILKLIHEHSDDFIQNCDTEHMDLHDVLLKMQRDHLLLGLSDLAFIDNQFKYKFSNLRLSYEGLKLLEENEKHYNWG
ncbi:MAG: hypothetical protein JXR88_03340 [Clostridia bacterium]|nr:hypothetical protein [Clostridia bacterium]